MAIYRKIRTDNSGVGERYGMVTVTGPWFWMRIRRQSPCYAVCVCDCGATFVTKRESLTRGRTVSCGCKTPFSTHGHCRNNSTTGEYRTWYAMIQRCTNPSNTAYRDYGGRGILVCERWRQSFEAFLSDMGPRPQKRSVDRIDVNGNYEPGNCRWATPREQALNKRNRLVTASGR